MGLGSAKGVTGPIRDTVKSSNSDAANNSVRIRRTYGDFPAPSLTPRRGDGGIGVLDARSLGASRPQGPRLELSPAHKARIEANRIRRGAAAAVAGKVLRAGNRNLRGGGRGGRRRNPRRRADGKNTEEDEGENWAAVEARVNARLAPPPRRWHDHEPEDVSLEDLRVDWPSIATGNVGMVESVQEKLRWMSRRMQHGYDTPQELAERLHECEMVHFESAEEKEQVLKAARELVKGIPSWVSKRPGLHRRARDVTFQSVGDRDRTVLGDEFIKGHYPPIEGDKKQSHRFLDEVVRILGTNETYHAREKGQLLDTIQKLLPQPQAQAQAQAQLPPKPAEVTS